MHSGDASLRLVLQNGVGVEMVMTRAETIGFPSKPNVALQDTNSILSRIEVRPWALSPMRHHFAMNSSVALIVAAEH